MKNKILFALLFAMPMFFTSCLKDQEDVFDKSASERLDIAMNDMKEVLMSTEDCWLMDYYYGEEYAYGGHAFFMKFDSTKVTIWSENDLKGATSYYKMSSHNGPVLSLDTFNDVLHTLAAPNQSMPEGFEADFEFTVVSATADLVKLRGLRTNNICYLRPFNGDKVQYVQAMNSVVEDLIVQQMDVTLNGKLYAAMFDLDERRLDFAEISEENYDPIEKAYIASQKVWYTYTDKGIRLTEPLKAEGKSFLEFTFDAETDKFACVEADNQGVVFTGKKPEGYTKYNDFEGDYYFTMLGYDENDTPAELGFKVSLVKGVDNQSYLMTGASSKFDIVLTFNKSKGCLVMNTQAVGTYNGYNVFFQAANLENGLYPGIVDFGMMTEMAYNEDGSSYYKWVSIPNEYLEMDSFCLWLVDNNGNSGGQLYNVAEWQFAGGLNMLSYVMALRRIQNTN